MDAKTKGAWLIHHAKKVQATMNHDFDSIAFSGKAGILLSAISSEDQIIVPKSRLEALAKANGISPRSELPSFIKKFERQKLLLSSTNGVEILGLTGHSILEQVSRIYDESNHETHEDAVIIASDLASEYPKTDKDISEYLSDSLKLDSEQVRNTLDVSCQIGFFDSEPISNKERLLFNGNLFRRENATKINAVLSSLSQQESRLMIEANQKLDETGCLPLNSIVEMLGQNLFDRLSSIGLFDINVVGNEEGERYFITRPAAFSKFSNSIADDALDLAKALVASLTYGMTVSSYYRGRIQQVSALMRKLISGNSVGPATAIGKDYQALEIRGVISVTKTDDNMFTMKLLKPEVGRLALEVIENGNITTENILSIPGASITKYIDPESNRKVKRKNITDQVRAQMTSILQEIRTGGLK